MPQPPRSSASTCNAATIGARTSGSSGACTSPSTRWRQPIAGIADIDHAPRNANGKVEFSSDLLFFKPKDARRARGTVFLEVVNRGRDQSLAILSGAQQRNLSPESWNLGDGFLLEQGFAVAFLGWQFDVRPLQGLTFTAPIAAVEGLVRDAHIELAHPGGVEVPLTYCVAESGRTSAALTFRTRMDETPQPIPRDGLAAGVRRLLDARDVGTRYRCLRGGLSRAVVHRSPVSVSPRSATSRRT